MPKIHNVYKYIRKYGHWHTYIGIHNSVNLRYIPNSDHNNSNSIIM